MSLKNQENRKELTINMIRSKYLMWELSALSSLSKALVEPHLATWANPLDAMPP